MSAMQAFLWSDGLGHRGITGSLDGAWRVAARGLDAVWMTYLTVTVREALPTLTEELEDAWEPTGRGWTGRTADGGADVTWTAELPGG